MVGIREVSSATLGVNDVRSLVPSGYDVFYRLDRADRFTAYGGGWSRFAADNDGHALLARSVIGQPLASFITGEPTRMFMATVLSAARVRQAPREYDYRCDSPALRRDCRMYLLPEPGGCILVAHRVVNTSSLTRAVRWVLNDHAAGALLRCSMCGWLKIEGSWEPSDGSTATANLETVRVAYGVCPTCSSSVRKPRRALREA